MCQHDAQVFERISYAVIILSWCINYFKCDNLALLGLIELAIGFFYILCQSMAVN